MKSAERAITPRAAVSNKIVISKTSLSKEQRSEIYSNLTLLNPDWEKAEELLYSTYGIEKWLKLYEVDGNWLILPRGFAARLTEIVEDLEWRDHRSQSTDQHLRRAPSVALRQPQIAPVGEILKRQQGIYMAPTGCITGDSIIHINRASKGITCSIEHAYKKWNNIRVDSHGPGWNRAIPTYARALVSDQLRQHLVENIVYSGLKNCLQIEFKSGKILKCTPDHLIAQEDGWTRADNLNEGDAVLGNGRYIDKDGYVWLSGPQYADHPRVHGSREKGWQIREHHIAIESIIGRQLKKYEIVHHINENKQDNRPENLKLTNPSEHAAIHADYSNFHGAKNKHGDIIYIYPCKEIVKSIKYIGIQKTYDLIMQDPHNNFVANGIVVHNSGKTVAALEAIRQAGQRAIVIVGTTHIAKQWGERIEQFLPGISYGIVGDKQFDDAKSITIALQQTLWARYDQLKENNFFKQFGFVCLDEMHHIRSETYQYTVQEFGAKYRIGISATPDRNDGKFPLAEAAIGSIIYETTENKLVNKNILIRPKVVKVNTKFEAEFWGNYLNEKKRLVQSNYKDVINKLIDDKPRAYLVVKKIMENKNHACLVLSRRLCHLDLFQTVLLLSGYNEDRIFMLTGREKTDDRMKVYKEAENGECVILSTIADEALDIPRLDRLFLTFPAANPAIIKQQIGRIKRQHPDKQDAIIYDFVDSEIGVFRKQWQNRLNNVYSAEGLEVIVK